MEKKCIWITWEKQRRSIELSKSFGAEYYELSIPSFFLPFPPIRYFIFAIRTFIILLSKKPKLVFCQNPSIILASLLCVWKYVFKFKLVVDRHSNFKLNKLQTKSIQWRVFYCISKFSLKYADLTIVTNDYLYNLVNSWGGKSCILQDKLPELQYDKIFPLPGEKNIIFISSFSDDEPLEEIIKSATLINDKWFIHITGAYKDRFKKKYYILAEQPSNIKFTGFLSEKIYANYLYSADLIIVLTTQDHTLTCGAYEAMTIGKPFILSDTTALRNYFRYGAIYTKPSANSIAKAIKEGIQNYTTMQYNIIKLRKNLIFEWEKRFTDIKKIILSL